MSSSQLLERINLTIEQKSLPLYDVGASFRLTRNNHPQIKYKDGFQDLIIQILTVLKNGLIPKISLFYQEGKPWRKSKPQTVCWTCKTDNKCQNSLGNTKFLGYCGHKSMKLYYTELSSSWRAVPTLDETS